MRYQQKQTIENAQKKNEMYDETQKILASSLGAGKVRKQLIPHLEWWTQFTHHPKGPRDVWRKTAQNHRGNWQKLPPGTYHRRPKNDDYKTGHRTFKASAIRSEDDNLLKSHRSAFAESRLEPKWQRSKPGQCQRRSASGDISGEPWFGIATEREKGRHEKINTGSRHDGTKSEIFDHKSKSTSVSFHLKTQIKSWTKSDRV